MAGGGVEDGSAELLRSTRRDITWPNRRSDLRLGKYPLYHPDGTACVLALYAGKRRCLRHYRRLSRVPARHTFPGDRPSNNSLNLSSKPEEVTVHLVTCFLQHALNLCLLRHSAVQWWRRRCGPG